MNWAFECTVFKHSEFEVLIRETLILIPTYTQQLLQLMAAKLRVHIFLTIFTKESYTIS